MKAENANNLYTENLSEDCLKENEHLKLLIVIAYLTRSFILIQREGRAFGVEGVTDGCCWG